MNLAHAARRCSGPTAPPDQWRCLPTATSPKRLQAFQHLPSPPGAPQKPQQNHLQRLQPHDCCQHPAVRLQRLQHHLHRTCSGLCRDAANTVTEPKHCQSRQALRLLQWNADGHATKQHELRLRFNDDSIDICLIQETKLLPKYTTPSFPGFCAIRADRPINHERFGGLLTLIRDDLVLQKTGEEYSPPLERLTVQVQLSRRKWATIHNTYAAPIRSTGITDTLDFARLQMGHLTFLGGDLNAHSHLWDTNQPSDARGEQLEAWVIANSASVLNDGTATLLNRATVDLSSPDVS